MQTETRTKGINIHCTNHADEVVKTYSRKDFYKICLFFGENRMEYANRVFNTNGILLFFGTPHIPYSSHDIYKAKSYSCLFTEEFLKTNNNSESLQQSPLFKIGGTPLFSLTKEQSEPIAEIFEKMITTYNSDYIYKNDLIRNYINLIIHEALQLNPSENHTQHKNAPERVASFFLELLERQFPIENTSNPLTLKTAKDYAQSLSIHVNHLNHSVKTITGKTTSAHISERVITEAKALLKHTNWSIAEIGYALGFDYPTYFNSYFKRHTKITPANFR